MEYTPDVIDDYYKNLRVRLASPALDSSDPTRFQDVQMLQQAEEHQDELEYIENNSFLDRTTQSFVGSLSTTTALGSMANEVSKRVNLFSEGGVQAALFEDPLKEEGWSFYENDDARAQINDTIDRLGVDPESADARRLRSARGPRDLTIIEDRIVEKYDHAKHIKNSGFVAGELAGFLGAIPDLDMVVGGAAYKPLAAAAKMGRVGQAIKVLPKGENIVAGAAAGLTAATVNESARALLDDGDPQGMVGTVAFATLFGVAVGGVLPSTIKQLGDDFVDTQATHALMKEHVSAQPRTGPQSGPDEVSPAIDREVVKASDAALRAELDRVVEDTVPESAESASVGAAATDTYNIAVPEKSRAINDYVDTYIESDPDFAQDIRNYFDFVDPERSKPTQVWQQGVQRVYDSLDFLNVLPDHDKGMRSNNSVLQFMTAKLTNSPLGIMARQTGDNIAVRLEDSFRETYAPTYEATFTDWANRQGYKFTETKILTNAEDEFGRLVQRELNARRYGESITDDPAIKAAADDYGNTTAKMLNEAKVAGVEGFEDVPVDPGYFPVRHNKMKYLEYEHKVGNDNLLASIKDGILRHNSRTGGEVSEQDAFVWASAIVRHARSRDGANPMSSLHTVSEDLRPVLEDILTERGVPRNQLQAAVDELVYNGESGTVKRSRRRVGIDYTTPIRGDSGSQLFDLIDQDVFGALDSLTRGQSGEIARVRATNGLIQKKDVPAWLQAVHDNARARGVDPAKDVRIAEDILTQFTEGAYSGGISANVSRLNRMTTTSFMSQMALPQIGETGIMVSKGGVSAFQKHMGESVQAFMKKQSSDYVNSLAVSGKYYRPDELMGRVLNLDEVAYGSAQGIGRVVDTALDRGTRLLGEVSLFYRLNGAQQTMSLQINNQFLFDNIAKLSKRRLKAYGVDDEVIAIYNKYKDTVTKDADGSILDNNFENWNPADMDRWRDLLRQNVDYDVQVTRRGFGHAATQRNDFVAVYAKLKSFAMNAFFSKALRNARLADRLAAAEIAYNTAFSAIAVGAWATVNGKWDTLDKDRFASRVLGWSAHLSPVMMMTDPISYMLGLDYVGDNKSSPLQRYRGYADGMFSLPAPVTAASNLLSVPRAVGSLLDDGDLEYDNIKALKSVPIVGRMYGVPWLLDSYYKSTK